MELVSNLRREWNHNFGGATPQPGTYYFKSFFYGDCAPVHSGETCSIAKLQKRTEQKKHGGPFRWLFSTVVSGTGRAPGKTVTARTVSSRRQWENGHTHTHTLIHGYRMHMSRNRALLLWRFMWTLSCFGHFQCVCIFILYNVAKRACHSRWAECASEWFGGGREFFFSSDGNSDRIQNKRIYKSQERSGCKLLLLSHRMASIFSSASTLNSKPTTKVYAPLQ